MALDAATRKKKSGYNQMLSRLTYSGKPINLYVTIEYENTYEFQSRKGCISCDHSSTSTEKDREPRRAGPWDTSHRIPEFCILERLELSGFLPITKLNYGVETVL